MRLFEARASTILYKVLKSIKIEKPFLLPLNICPIVPTLFSKVGVSFEFIDISNNNFHMNHQILLQKVSTGEYGGVLYVRTYGAILSSGEDIFREIKSIDREFFIIDDRCLSFPDFQFDITLTEADLVLFSTGYSKYIDIDWGGFGFLSDEYSYNNKLFEKFVETDLERVIGAFRESLDNKTQLDKRFINSSWLDFKSVESSSFETYRENIENRFREMKLHKKNINSIYYKELPEDIILNKEFQDWRFNIVVPNKEDVLKEIFNNNLFASSHYSHVDFIFFEKSLSKGSIAEELHSRVINLFNDHRFTEEMAYNIVKVVNKAIV
jgi:hypothetical protein